MKKNKIFSFLVVGAIALNSMVVNIQAVTTMNVVDEYIERETVSKGLEYEYKQKLTDQGIVDVYVLDYDMNESNIDIDILRSSDWAKRDTLTNLIKDEGAIAGVNASFFDTSNIYSDPLGLEVENGSVSYAKENYNKTVANANSIMIDKDNNVSIGYVSSNIKLYTEGGVTLYVSAINGMQDFANANVFNRNAMYDTSSIDAKQWQYKFVVDGGVITYIANPKEVVVIPENGYVITANKELYDKLLPKMPKGTKMYLEIKTNIPEKFANLDLLLSGGGTLLKNSEVIIDGIAVQANSRAPRTAIGYTADNHIICMVVDGRGTSKGATLTEMAYYMKEYGVTDAISLDGGGSSAIAHRDTDNVVKLDNVPSDGAQRKVTNGVGFVTTNEVGYSNTIEIISKGRTFMNTNMPLDIIGYDVNLNRAYIDKNIVEYSVEGVTGYFNGHNFIATSTGVGTITAKHGGNIGTTQVIVQDEILDINITQTNSAIKPNGTVTFHATALDKDGYTLPYSVGNLLFSSTLGTMDGNVFTSNGQVGKAVITVTNGSITKSVYVNVNSQPISAENTAKTAPTYPVHDTMYTTNAAQLNIVGKINVADPVVGQVATNLGSSVPTIFGGITTNYAMSINNGRLKSSVYKATNNDALNTTIIELNTKSNTVISSDSAQWKKMLDDMKTGRDNIVIIANYSPNDSAYTEIEGKLLKARLEEIQRTLGKNIYWVNCNSTVNSVKYVEGIRYVSLPKKSYSNSNVSEKVNVLGLYNDNGVLKYNLK